LSVSFSRPVLLRIYDAAGGNPFFALELARAAAEAAERGDVLAIPESLRELVLIRLAALPDETRAALLVVAALGQPRSSIVAAAARGAPETAAELAKQARRLTPPSRLDLRATRALDEAAYAWSAGDAQRSETTLLELIESLPPSPVRAAARQLLVKIMDDVEGPIAQLDLALEDAAGAPAP